MGGGRRTEDGLAVANEEARDNQGKGAERVSQQVEEGRLHVQINVFPLLLGHGLGSHCCLLLDRGGGGWVAVGVGVGAGGGVDVPWFDGFLFLLLLFLFPFPFLNVGEATGGVCGGFGWVGGLDRGERGGWNELLLVGV